MTQMTTTTTTTTMRTRLAHRGPALKGCMENPQASESHHYYRHQRRRGRGRRQQRSAPHWQKFKSSEPSWPRRAPTPPQRLRLRLSVSRMDLAGALIDFVPVRIVYYHAQTHTHTLFHFGWLVGAAVPVMPRRPGASLANPNKAARRVTAVEFASDSDDA